jgi:hypothetical protein
MLEFKWRILDQVEERVVKLEKEMKAILEEENRQNLEKVVEYMTTHYPTPYSGPFGSGPHHHLQFICVTMCLLL